MVSTALMAPATRDFGYVPKVMMAEGMERMASRVATMTTGKISNASVRPAVSTLWPKLNW